MYKELKWFDVKSCLDAMRSGLSESCSKDEMEKLLAAYISDPDAQAALREFDDTVEAAHAVIKAVFAEVAPSYKVRLERRMRDRKE